MQSRRGILLGSIGAAGSRWLRAAGRGSLRANVNALRPAAHEDIVFRNLDQHYREVLSAIQHPATAAAADAARAGFTQKLEYSLGYRKLPWPPVLNARVTGSIKRSGYRVDKVVYDSLPGVPVAAHLYLPERIAGRIPALVFFNGHWPKESKMLPTHQALCVNLSRRGFAVLNFDPPGQGERGLSSRDHRRAELLPVGVSQEGLMEYETQCAIEYLLSRPEIDPDRLGMTGASGGGFQTWITAALDPRIRAAAPVVGTCDFYEQVAAAADKDWNPKDHCHKVPRLEAWANNHELLAIAAPKPVLIVSSVLDTGFPIAGARRVFAYGRGLYASYGAPERIAMFEDTYTGHDFERPKREAVYGWFERWLMDRGDGKPSAEPPTEVEPVDSGEMRCFGNGPNRAAGPGIVRAAQALAGKTRQKRPIPDYQTCLGKLPAEPAQYATGIRGRVARLIIPSEANLQLPAYLLRPEGDARGVVVGAHDRGKEYLADQPVCRQALARGWAFCGVDPRGIGELASTHPHWLFSVHLLLGDHLPWRQGWDLAQAARYASSEFPGRPIAFYGDGDGPSLAVAYALAMPATRRLARKGFITRGGFLSFRDFLRRPESEAKSFALQDCAPKEERLLDREIPASYFVFDALRQFDLADLYGEPRIRGLAVDPIDGDWRVMGSEAARQLLPADVFPVNSRDFEARLPEFFAGLEKS